MARDAGANKVFFASAAAPVRFPNVYGIDMPTRNELIAHERDTDAVRSAIGADALVYQDVDDLARSVSDVNPSLRQFDSSCFDGSYVTGDVTAMYLDRLESFRNRTNQTRSGSDVDTEHSFLNLQAPALS